MKRFVIHVGGYGSGKTELSLNTAMAWAKEGRRVMLVDLDIVNPYFRSGEHGRMLEHAGIGLIAPTFANTTVDVPALSPRVLGVFDGQADVIFDVGGDPVGAAALGQYASRLGEAQVRMVINHRRPLTGTVEAVIEMLRVIEMRSRLKVTGLINNANLADETGLSDILEGQALVEEVSRQTGIPVEGVMGLAPLLAQLPALAPLAIPIRRYTRPDWL